ncbi:hypothetical protein PDG61_22050 [Mycolicibacterium sp. BiH015]|uniref:hypothetical protein n=1 Tax=Mycolicibacterium sp. BiH015 TaxID=3018808 RepID=UPI0022E8E0FE|nr:hypothetical protein [Mycolicibacterium sp. BiH015]MDA2893615.1 hypothetical protein [Mycolicibacterium sp. BiH015]
MPDDEKTRWAIDVLTAWVDHEDDSEFMHARVDSYLSEADGPSGLTTGLINLAGLLLMGLETSLGRSAQEILQTIAITVSRQSERPE